MKRYLVEITETVVKRVWIEAETTEEVENEAAMEDLSKNFDDYSMEIKVLETEEIEDED